MHCCSKVVISYLNYKTDTSSQSIDSRKQKFVKLINKFEKILDYKK